VALLFRFHHPDLCSYVVWHTCIITVVRFQLQLHATQVPPSYYSRTLQERASMLGCHTRQLTKALILKGTAGGEVKPLLK
jgi:hypothetical protein